MFQGYEHTLNAVLWAHLFSSFASYMMRTIAERPEPLTSAASITTEPLPSTSAASTTPTSPPSY